MSVLHAKIAETTDPDFQRLIDELYHCVNWERDDTNFPTLWYLLGGIGAQNPKALAAAFLPTEGILTTKVEKLSQGVVYDLCCELAKVHRSHIEAYDGKRVLSLLKSLFPKPPSRRKPTRGEIRHEAATRLILQRRANGDL